MGRYIVRRLGYLIPVWLGISLLAYSLANLAPGDPAAIILRRQTGEVPSDEAVRALRADVTAAAAMVTWDSAVRAEYQHAIANVPRRVGREAGRPRGQGQEHERGADDVGGEDANLPAGKGPVGGDLPVAPPVDDIVQAHAKPVQPDRHGGDRQVPRWSEHQVR